MTTFFNKTVLLDNAIIQLLDKDLYKHINHIYDIIQNKFPYLIKTDEEWSNLTDKNIFYEFHNQYFNNYVHNDFILFICLKCDINRLKNILYKNNEIINRFFSPGDFLINVSLFLSFFNSIYNNRHCNWIYTSYFFNYIDIRIILPIYPVIIPYYFKLMKQFNKALFMYAATNIYYFFHTYVNKVLNYSFNNINNLQALSLIDQEFLDKYKKSILSIQNIVENYFIKNPYIEVLHLLLKIAVKPINKLTTYHVINFIKKEKCSLSLLKPLKKILADESTYIDSLILLNAL